MSKTSQYNVFKVKNQKLTVAYSAPLKSPHSAPSHKLPTSGRPLRSEAFRSRKLTFTRTFECHKNGKQLNIYCHGYQIQVEKKYTENLYNSI
jgi:hypothetical protein